MDAWKEELRSLEEEIRAAELEIFDLEARLENVEWLERTKPSVVEDTKERLRELRRRIESHRRSILQPPPPRLGRVTVRSGVWSPFGAAPAPVAENLAAGAARFRAEPKVTRVDEWHTEATVTEVEAPEPVAERRQQPENTAHRILREIIQVDHSTRSLLPAQAMLERILDVTASAGVSTALVWLLDTLPAATPAVDLPGLPQPLTRDSLQALASTAAVGRASLHLEPTVDGLVITRLWRASDLEAMRVLSFSTRPPGDVVVCFKQRRIVRISGGQSHWADEPGLTRSRAERTVRKRYSRGQTNGEVSELAAAMSRWVHALRLKGRAGALWLMCPGNLAGLHGQWPEPRLKFNPEEGAKLAAHDGAVLVDSTGLLLGFGISRSAPAPEHVVTEPFTDPLRTDNRVRAAMHFCLEHESGIAFVVSQDGTVTMVFQGAEGLCCTASSPLCVGLADDGF